MCVINPYRVVVVVVIVNIAVATTDVVLDAKNAICLLVFNCFNLYKLITNVAIILLHNENKAVIYIKLRYKHIKLPF